jgi:hypothetical protein
VADYQLPDLENVGGATMATQVVGTLVSAMGILWFAFSLTLDRAGQQQAVLSLWGVVAFVGGLILWALGRIECAISWPSEQSKRSQVLSLILLLVIMLVPMGAAFLYFFSSSFPENAAPKPNVIERRK